MSQTKLGPTLTVSENDNHESHSFWFENFKCSVKVDRRKDGAGLAITLKTPESKVVVNIGPQAAPRLVAQVKHSGPWTPESQCSSEVRPDGVVLRLDYEPKAAQ